MDIFVIFAVKSEDNRSIFIMKITDNIIIYEAHEFPQLLMQPFYSDYVGIVICHHGMFRFCVDGTSFVASVGETVFLSKGVMFHVQETGKNLKYTLLFYRAEQIRHMLGNTVVTMRLYATIYPKSCHVRTTGYEDMLTSYALMLRKLELEKEKSGELDAYCVHEQKLLLMAVTYRLCSIFSASFKAAGKEMERKIAIFESLVLLIEKNYMRERSVAFYADELCLTPKYLSVLVKSVCGQTVQQLLFKAMIRRSIYLMKNTTKTIQQIANELSFPNASAFGTFFKKHTGLSPKHYRNWEEGMNRDFILYL